MVATWMTCLAAAMTPSTGAMGAMAATLPRASDIAWGAPAQEVISWTGFPITMLCKTLSPLSAASAARGCTAGKIQSPIFSAGYEEAVAESSF